MQVNFERPPGRREVLIGRLGGAVNALAADQLWQSTTQQLEDETRFVVFDFSEVTMLTSAGIGILVRLYTRLKDRGGGLAVFGCSGKIREIFDHRHAHRCAQGLRHRSRGPTDSRFLTLFVAPTSRLGQLMTSGRRRPE